MPRLLVSFSLHSSPSGQSTSDWPTFGHDPAGTRYSPLTQINTTNVTAIKRAWTFHMSPDSAADPSAARMSESTPLMVNGKLYLTTPYHHIVALEPETGKLLWSYELPGEANPAVRGLEFYPGDPHSPPQIVFGTSDAKLISLNANTGKPVPGFGNEERSRSQARHSERLLQRLLRVSRHRPSFTATWSSLELARRNPPAWEPPATHVLGTCTPANWSGNFTQCLNRENSVMILGKAIAGRIAPALTSGA